MYDLIEVETLLFEQGVPDLENTLCWADTLNSKVGFGSVMLICVFQEPSIVPATQY